jgi:hypothetical protein
MSVETLSRAVSDKRLPHMDARTLIILDLLLRRDLVSTDAIHTQIAPGIGDKELPDARSLSVYVSKLRKTLEPIGVEIGNRRGLGWYIPTVHREKMAELINGAKVSLHRDVVVPPPAPDPPPIDRSHQRTVRLPGGAHVVLSNDIPIPTGNDARRVYAFEEMEIGESQLVEGKKKNSVQSAIQGYRRSRPGNMEKRFVVREVEGGCRIWRER